jgi:type IV pilus assembly protein PilW
MTSSIRAVNKGFSLVELMTAMAVSLIVVAAAAVLFAETGQNQRALDQISNANEVGSFVLRLVGRDLANAGFYPVEAGPEGAGGSGLGVYVKPTGLPTPVDTSGKLVDAYGAGLFGCEGGEDKKFIVPDGNCGESTGGNKADSLVVSYYTTDGFGATGIGHQLDCAGDNVAALPVNGSASAPAASSPTKPLFVANHYYLSDPDSLTMKFNGQQVTTRSLRCRGLGGAEHRELISGLDDFQVTYGVAQSMESDSKVKFFNAHVVKAQGTTAPDPVTGKTFSPWQRVVAVRVCVISKTYETSGVSVGGGTWTGCDGVLKTAAATDSAVRKTYTQIFGIKNHLKVLY